VRYAPTAYIVRCPLCRWQVTLLAGEGWEFVQALTGMSRTDPALFLREIARRSSDVAAPSQVVGVRAGQATKQRVIAPSPTRTLYASTLNPPARRWLSTRNRR